MKPTFSIGDALGSPFQLARRRPVTVFLWGAIVAAIVVGIYAMLLPMFANIPLGEGQGDAALAEYARQSRASAMGINAMTP